MSNSKETKIINFSFKFMEVTFDFQPKKEMRIKDDNQKNMNFSLFVLIFKHKHIFLNIKKKWFVGWFV